MEVTPVFTNEERAAVKFAELKADVDNLRMTLPLMIEHSKMFAQLTRAKYLGLIDAGFTKNEAFALCK